MRNIYFVLLTFVILAFSSLFISSCSEDSTNGEGNIVGTWILIKMTMQYQGLEVEYTPDEMDFYITLTINEDGTYTVFEIDEGETDTIYGTWSIEGNKLIISDPTITQECDYSCTSTRLKIWLEDFILDGESITVIQEFTRQ